MIKFFKDVKRRKAQGEEFRPIWQIVLLLFVMPFYWLANTFVEFMDNHI
jgi:hypothetical protein